ncbi:MAG: hypothetical protein QM680_04445 [Luteolibacter sp.]
MDSIYENVMAVTLDSISQEALVLPPDQRMTLSFCPKKPAVHLRCTFSSTKSQGNKSPVRMISSRLSSSSAVFAMTSASVSEAHQFPGLFQLVPVLFPDEYRPHALWCNDGIHLAAVGISGHGSRSFGTVM